MLPGCMALCYDSTEVYLTDTAFFFSRSLEDSERRKKHLVALLWGRGRTGKRTGDSELWADALMRERMQRGETGRWFGSVSKHGQI